MKKFYLIPMAASVLLGLAACSSDDLASINPSSTTTNDENVPINFGSYVGNAQSTRATANNIISADSLAKAGGFGVFAINTETKTYDADNSDDHTLYKDYNYMFNQQVTGNKEGTTWTTNPVKYWPNKTLTTTTTGEGKDAVTTASEEPVPQYVTFFAYAPYLKIGTGGLNSVAESQGTDNYKGGGILQISDPQEFEKWTATNDQGKYFSKADPVIALDVTNASNQTDLLWGTAGNNGVSEDYDGTDENPNLNTGKQLKNNKGDKDVAGSLGGKYPVNADLTKMKTDGKVSFNFKHALAKIGGHKANEASSENTITIDAVADALNNGDTKQLANDSRISLKWLAIEVMGTKNNTDTVAYPTKGFFNLATGLWGQMAKDITSNGSTYASYPTANNPVYVMYPNGTEKTFNYGNITPYLSNKTSDNYKKIPLNSALTVNADGGDKYNDVITATAEDPSNVDDQGKVIPASSKWNENAKEGVKTTAASVFVSDKDADPLLIIPNSTIKPKIRVIASYDIVTLDPAYAEGDATEDNAHIGYTKAHQVLASDVTFDNVAQLNKKYNLHIHLGVTSIKVNATVDDWDDASETGTVETAEESKDVDLPANVSGSTTPSTGE